MYNFPSTQDKKLFGSFVTEDGDDWTSREEEIFYGSKDRKFTKTAEAAAAAKSSQNSFY
jgi:hypothetical protein